jgi:hypothetical protein
VTKIVLQDLASLTNETSALATMNANSAVIETASDSFLSRDGTTPNQMGADLDMNSHRILNIGTPLDMNNSRIIDLPDAVALTEPVTLNQLNNAIFSGGGASATLPFITVSNTPSLSQERALAVTGSGLTLTDGGANGSITVGLDDDLNAIASLATTGLVTRTAANTMTTRSLTQPAAGITISNNDGVAGNPTLALANDLGALEGLATTGIARRTGADTWTASNAVTNAELNTTANQTIKSNISGGVATPSDNTLTSILDNVIGSSRGSIAVRGAANWQALALGTNTQVLSSNGTDLVYAAGGSGSSLITRRTITATDTVVVGDLGNIIEITSGTFTLAFTAAATLANGFNTIIYNSGTGDVTLDPNGAEQIDGLTTWVLYPGGAVLVMCTGTAFESVLLAPMRKQFDASGTFTKPGVGAFVRINGWGAGGAGGKGHAAATAAGAGGGGGGTMVDVQLLLSTFGTTETVTIGTGGASQTTDSTNGANGGNTTIGSLFTAYGGGGGGGGANSTFGCGGGGGGALGAGGQGSSAAAGLGGGPSTSTSTLSLVGEANSGFGGANGTGLGTVAGGNAGMGGAGGGCGQIGATAATAGGSGVYGGGAGGGSSVTGTAGAAGTSVFGGNGGAGGSAAANGTAGTQPGGGGGASHTGNSGAGADGRAIIYIW